MFNLLFNYIAPDVYVPPENYTQSMDWYQYSKD